VLSTARRLILAKSGSQPKDVVLGYQTRVIDSMNKRKRCTFWWGIRRVTVSTEEKGREEHVPGLAVLCPGPSASCLLPSTSTFTRAYATSRIF
jgi:hypothetical protein